MPTSTPGELSLRELLDRGARPFPPHPQVDRYFPAASIEEARRRLTRAIERGDGPGLVVGGPGTGKTLLLQALAAHFHERFDVVLLGCTRVCTRRALLQSILFELGLPHRLRDEGHLRFELLDHLLSAKQSPSELLLLVDEAQTLTVTLLDELRILTNLIHGGLPRVRLVLAGSPALEETFASPELESFSQRLAARCYLTPFTRDETAQFIRAQLAATDAAVVEILRPEAWEAVFEATDGVPRLVNQLSDHAITVAVTQNCKRLDRRVVQGAWSELQQLPSPWETSAATESAGAGIVEFGSLMQEVATIPSPPAATLNVEFPQEDDGCKSNCDTVEYIPPPTAASATSAAVTLPPASALPASPGAAAVPQPARVSANPFAERFDEEEVVIDTFASVSDMTRFGAPRVENRRDPDFASLVQAIIEAAPTPAPTGIQRAEEVQTNRLLATAVEFSLPATEESAHGPVDEVDANDMTDLRRQDAERFVDDFDSNWPPIRLVFSDESETNDTRATSWLPDNPGPIDEGRFDDTAIEADWAGGEASAAEFSRDDFSLAGEPILVVEEDEPDRPRHEPNPPSRSDVRRQEYRRLFSRLRSG
jgi:type II secretory pathway predicted ATPase ExeA